jgi:adenylate kinase family enzyme
MNDYDFSTLNDKEFEILTTDLLSIKEKIPVDRFKSGRDKGIDGKFYTKDNSIVIVQAKHWLGSGIKKLINHCKKTEKHKVQKLDPTRYIFVCSLPLSDNDRIELSKIFFPYLHESDIYGKEKLNDLLKQPACSHIEKNHYKLWLSSTRVLSLILNSGVYSKSERSFEEIKANCKYYVKTNNHDKADKILQESNCLIITGEPGAGKTTLAENLCFEYIQYNYEFIEIEDDIDAGWDVLSKDQNQLFYFDDFLGRNYLDGLYNREDSKIVKFMKAIKSAKNKKFILTSRSSILNQGKQYSELFKINKIHKNEFELNVSNLTELEKAYILYNHIYFSQLPVEFIDQFYEQKRYRSLITHKNFNPRLISFITDIQRYDHLDKDEYWNKINNQMNNPKDIWEFVFDQQINSQQRVIILLVTVNNKRISDESLLLAYIDYCKLNNLRFELREFNLSLKILTGSLLNRFINEGEIIFYNLFNPSIADYLLPLLYKDYQDLASIITALNNVDSFKALLSLKSGKLISKTILDKTIKEITNKVEFLNFDTKYFELYTRILNSLKKDNHKIHLKTNQVRFFINELNINGFDWNSLYEGLNLFETLFDNGEFDDFEINWDKIITSSLNHAPDHHELILISHIIIEAQFHTTKDYSEVFSNRVLEYWSDQIHQDVDEVLSSDISMNELDSIPDRASSMVSEFIEEYQVDVSHIENEIYENINTEAIEEGIVESYEEGQYEEHRIQNYSKKSYHSRTVTSDEIDKLFER